MKYQIEDIFYSILTEAPYGGVPCCFIVFGKKGKKKSTKKIIKKVNKICASHTVYLKGETLDPMDTQPAELVTALKRAGFVIRIETNGEEFDPMVPLVEVKSQYHSQAGLSVLCTPRNKSINKKLLPYISCFRYSIIEGKQGKDGLPKNVFKTNTATRIVITPSSIGDFKKNIIEAIRISKEYGFYISFPVYKMIGIKG